MSGSTQYDATYIYENDMSIINKMVAHIVATLNLVNLSTIKTTGLVSFATGSSLVWKTPLGKIVANNLTCFRDEKIGLISESIERINRYKNESMEATHQFITLIDTIDVNQFVNSCYYNSLTDTAGLGLLTKFERVLEQRINSSTKWSTYKTNFHLQAYESHN